MSQVLDNGRTIAFGQDLDEVEQTFGIKAEDDPSPVARKGVDKLLRTALLGLEFDSGKLDTITFEQGYEFRNPPSPILSHGRTLSQLARCGFREEWLGRTFCRI
jgi:hypothetical protein